MINMSLSEIATHLGISSSSDIVFTGLSKDSRNITPGNLYIAIRGEQFDGHDFVKEAFEKGAASALVEKKIDCPLPQLIVPDTLKALGQISKLWRSRFNIPFIAVTGSNGKTTLKNMIASILKTAGNVLATEGNLNNHIGVPLMLSRLNAEHQFAVIEMGMNHFHEIEYLTHLVEPQVAVINNAAEAHLEGLKNVAGVAQAKGEIFLGLTKNGIAILNRDDAHFDYWRSLVPSHKIISFGLQTSADVSADFSNQQMTLKTPAGKIDIILPLLGKHNMLNALAATATTLALNISLANIKKGLEKMVPAPGRMQQHRLENNACVIDDTYNANPFSLQAAIDTLTTFSGEKILVLGDMKELGPDAKSIHETMGQKIKLSGIQKLLTFGEMTEATSRAFGEGAHHFTDREKLIAMLKPQLHANVTVLIKGSRSMRMEKILSALIPNKVEHLH